MSYALAGQLVVILVLTFAGAFFLFIALDVLWQYGKALYCRTKLRRTIKSHVRRDAECDHEYALKRADLIKAVKSDLARPVPPILNQSERWQERARKAESLGFLDSFEDEPRPAA